MLSAHRRRDMLSDVRERVERLPGRRRFGVQLKFGTCYLHVVAIAIMRKGLDAVV